MSSTSEKSSGFDWTAHCATHRIAQPQDHIEFHHDMVAVPAAVDHPLPGLQLSRENRSRYWRVTLVAAALAVTAAATWIGSRTVVAALGTEDTARPRTTTSLVSLPIEHVDMGLRSLQPVGDAPQAVPAPQPAPESIAAIIEAQPVRTQPPGTAGVSLAQAVHDQPATVAAKPLDGLPRVQEEAKPIPTVPKLREPPRIVIKPSPAVTTASIKQLPDARPDPRPDPRLVPPANSALPSPPRPQQSPDVRTQKPEAYETLPVPRDQKAVKLAAIPPAAGVALHRGGNRTTTTIPPAGQAKFAARERDTNRKSARARKAAAGEIEYGLLFGMRVRLGNHEWAKELASDR